MNCLHIDYQINKEKYRKVFWEHYTTGRWTQQVLDLKNPRMCWWKVYGIEKLVEDVAKDLNIHGMNNLPRFAYLFQNNGIGHHVDEDHMTSIMINLNSDYTPTMHVEGVPIQYECLLFENGELFHTVEPRPVDTLMLKFCIRHPWEEVYERLDSLGYIV
jgi:hypothetical protein